ncbi:hypothetical protein DL89DRAFT_271733 [Linderina pennispora]|uniref:Extracellular metalloproteinase n=1 Tax=Linderina pennispora TaxID=61395 RepID=A0A1Y1VVW2_9FUNG|nr:uncharacterized protein DL89DRAFT_271733 [Linderina pennispora]ORX64894.1 hypothetical protein DL89DRAFT_271733 [Linderina pennispora]
MLQPLVFTIYFAALSCALISQPQQRQLSTPAKPFSPALSHRQPFTVYETPLSLNPIASPTAFSSSLAHSDPLLLQSMSIAATYLHQKHGIQLDSIHITDAYTDTATGLTHVYMVQTHDGLHVTNAVANVNIDKNGRVISSGHSFTHGPLASNNADFSSAALSTDSARAALLALANHIQAPLADTDLGGMAATSFDSSSGLTVTNLPAHFAIDGTARITSALLQNADGSVSSVWRVNAEQQDHWWTASIDTSSHNVLALYDWYSQSESYNVYAKDVLSPEDGKHTLVADPASKDASPKGWVTKGSTYGNNVWAQSNPTGGSTWQTNHRPKAGPGNVFDFPLNLSQPPESYIDAAIVQLFYTNNIMHDLSYIYGFDEAAGNFQDENFSGRGVGGDGVIANAQDGSGTNNANFATPPDGQRPRMRMYTWTQTMPNRDGDFEQDIVAHEFTHGISNRLTGGPANTDCLNDGESGGMGEGWSDAVSTILRLKSTDTHDADLVLGHYVYTKGIRNYPYSTSMDTNPSTYSYLDRMDYQEVHAIGEVWAEILYEVMWALIDKNGFADDIFAHDLTKGNSIMLQILLDGMKLQPCNPTFIDARNAIIQAEQNLTGGKNRCEIWGAFAKRGLGVNAPGGGWGRHTDDSSVPDGC